VATVVSVRIMWVYHRGAIGDDALRRIERDFDLEEPRTEI